MPFSSADVAEVRHVVQRILVPCVFVIGLLGNSVSIYVLTRKRMRCTTNIYLTALAMTDIIYLTTALLLSLKHYEYVQRHCEIYWQHYGTVVWICDACAYTSIYIAVCFTIERFIAIRYPLKRQTFCTESLAKKVIAGVALFCLLSTISTAFEHQYRREHLLLDPQGRPCNASDPWASPPPPSTPSPSPSSSPSPLTGPSAAPLAGDAADAAGAALPLPPPSSALDGSGAGAASADPVALDRVRRKRRAQEITLGSENIPSLERAEFLLDVAGLLATPPGLGPGLASPERREDLGDDNVTATLDYCRNVTVFQNGYSALGQDDLYRRIWYFFTLFVFVLVPLLVLATFNFFLIMLVRRSKNLRGEMTNASSIRRPKQHRKSTLSSVSQENRVTVTLIAVVLLFIVCQLPWAIYLIVSEHMDIDRSLQAIIGNVFNFLAAIHAAANFFLYCVLSDKYRRTVRELVTGYRYRSQRHTHTTASLYATTGSGVASASASAAANGSRRYRPSIIK